MTRKQTDFVQALQDSPIIAALKNDEGLEQALGSDCAIVFFLYGSILNIDQLVARVKERDKMAFVHADLIEGMTAKDIAANFIAQRTQADGIISTRPNIIRRAKALDLLTIQRFSCLIRCPLKMCCGKIPTPMPSICCRARCRASCPAWPNKCSSPSLQAVCWPTSRISWPPCPQARTPSPPPASICGASDRRGQNLFLAIKKRLCYSKITN